MQLFKSTSSGAIYAYEDYVQISITKGVSSATANGRPIDAPSDLTPYTEPTPTSAELLAAAQQAQVRTLTQAYQAAAVAPVTYTASAANSPIKQYQADEQSVYNLQASLAGCQASGETPTGFFWVAADNTQVPFTYADLQGLAAAIFAQASAAFGKLQTLKAQVNEATTVQSVQSVTW